MTKQYDSWNLIQLEQEAKSMRRYRIVKGLFVDLVAVLFIVAILLLPVYHHLFF